METINNIIFSIQTLALITATIAYLKGDKINAIYFICLAIFLKI